MYTDYAFLAMIKQYVLNDMRETKILASLTAAQAFIESNKGNSGLTKQANNLFGIKGEYNGHSVTMLTTEYYAGLPHKINAKFRKYPSWRESIADHSGLFNRSSRYKNLRGLTDYKLACVYVQQDGYATSPTYTKTLLNIIEKYRLYEWDAEVLGVKVDKQDPIYPIPSQSIRLGSSGQGVKWLQTVLNEKGYCLSVDGIAGNVTIGAVLDFQKKNGLEVDGIVGPKTRAALLR